MWIDINTQRWRAWLWYAEGCGTQFPASSRPPVNYHDKAQAWEISAYLECVQFDILLENILYMLWYPLTTLEYESTFLKGEFTRVCVCVWRQSFAHFRRFGPTLLRQCDSFSTVAPQLINVYLLYTFKYHVAQWCHRRTKWPNIQTSSLISDFNSNCQLSKPGDRRHFNTHKTCWKCFNDERLTGKKHTTVGWDDGGKIAK